MKLTHGILYVVLVCVLLTTIAGQSPRPQPPASTPEELLKFKVASAHPAYEWFFLVTDAGKEQNIWTKNGLDPEFVPVAGSSSQIKERIDAGTKVGFANAAEVTLAWASGVPVKTVAAYFGETTASIFVAANGPIRGSS